MIIIEQYLRSVDPTLSQCVCILEIQLPWQYLPCLYHWAPLVHITNACQAKIVSTIVIFLPIPAHLPTLSWFLV